MFLKTEEVKELPRLVIYQPGACFFPCRKEVTYRQQYLTKKAFDNLLTTSFDDKQRKSDILKKFSYGNNYVIMGF